MIFFEFLGHLALGCTAGLFWLSAKTAPILDWEDV